MVCGTGGPTLIAGSKISRLQQKRGAFLPHHETAAPFRTTALVHENAEREVGSADLL
jgi:hypothetical protein